MTSFARVPITVLLAVACLLLVVPWEAASAQQPTLRDPLLDNMIGKWVLTGTIARKPTTHDVSVRWVLNHQFVEIHEVSRDKRDGSSQYEAWVFLGWDSVQQRYVVHWIDVFGGGFSLRGYAPKQENSIAIVFESGDGTFHTTFSFEPSTRNWSWAMDNEQGGKLREFARLKMIRKQ
jgi:hypothetical protein